MIFFYSDLIFTAILLVGVYIFIRQELKLTLEIGGSGGSRIVAKPFASKNIHVYGTRAKYLGLALIGMSLFLMFFVKFGDVAFRL